MDRVDVYMPLYVRDFLTATIGWTAEERGHYLVLLMLQWDRGALPVELDGLERLSPGVSQCWAIVEPKFPVNAGVGRQNPKLEEHRARCLELNGRRSQAAQSAATRRWSSDASRIADASQTHRKRTAKICHPTSTSTSTSTPEEKDIQPAAPVPTSKPASPSGSRAKPVVSWSAEAGWEGISDADRSEWRDAYPGAVLDQELAKATSWLRANPKRCGRRNWRRFLVGWLQRCQDKGGTNREAGNRPAGPPPVDPTRRRFYRSDAGRSMTDREYEAWRRDGAGGAVTALAASLSLGGEA